MRNGLSVSRVAQFPGADLPRGAWPGTVPAVAQVLDRGLDLAPLTVLVGENGSGKSTLVEAIAGAFGLGVESGTRNALHQTQATESPLAEHLRLTREPYGTRQGVFLRAETMHGHFAYLGEIGVPGRHSFQSHGESFIEFIVARAGIRGLWIFDEPESALSFRGCLALLAHIRRLLAAGSQVILSTHSPILASLPEALIYELGEWGLRARGFDELELVVNWRAFLGEPERYLRHI